MNQVTKWKHTEINSIFWAVVVVVVVVEKTVSGDGFRVSRASDLVHNKQKCNINDVIRCKQLFLPHCPNINDDWQVQVSFSLKTLIVCTRGGQSAALQRVFAALGPFYFFEKTLQKSNLSKKFQKQSDFSLNKHKKCSQKGKKPLKFSAFWISNYEARTYIWPLIKKIWPLLAYTM